MVEAVGFDVIQPPDIKREREIRIGDYSTISIVTSSTTSTVGVTAISMEFPSMLTSQLRIASRPSMDV